MNKSGKTKRDIQALDAITRWWFAPLQTSSMRWFRISLALLAAALFADAMVDVEFWFGPDRPHASWRIASFLQLSGLADSVAASVSPLFWLESSGVIRAYLGLSVIACGWMIGGHGGRVAKVLVWLLLVFWANRLLWLSGLAETSLSLSLFAIAIAPERRGEPAGGPPGDHEAVNGLALRMLAVQGSVFAAATWLTMLGGQVWWDGTGAIAMAAPVTNRTFDVTEWLGTTWVHEGLTHAMMLMVPLGLALAWVAPGRTAMRIGVGLLIGWAAIVAVLASAWIHMGTLTVTFVAIVVCRSAAISSQTSADPAMGTEP